MVNIDIAAPYVDSRAADLRFSMDEPAAPAVAVHYFGDVEVRILGSSHQVVVGERIETVAYLPHVAQSLPATWSSAGHHMLSHVQRFDDEALATYMRDVIEPLAGADDAVVARFEGNPNAVTALQVARHPDHVEWRSWHVYPAAGEVVTTQSICGAASTSDVA